MADKTVGELPAAPRIYDDSLFVAEQQSQAVHVTAKQLRNYIGISGDSGSGGLGGGFIEMESAIPITDRIPNTLYGLILKEYGG